MDVLEEFIDFAELLHIPNFLNGERPILRHPGPPYPHWDHDFGMPAPTAVLAGTDTGGGPLFVGRTDFAGHLLPVKVAPNHQGAFIAWGGHEHNRFAGEFEVLHLLRGQANWVAASDGDVPPTAFPVGCTAEGDTVFVGRVPYKDTVTPGRIIPSEGVCCISYGGRELAFTKYEVLVIS